MSTTDRAQYRQMVQEVAAHAATLLPQAVNGRLAKAVALVLAGDVQPPATDGSVTVFSATDATRRYVLQGTSCTCADYERRQAPEGWCAHKIAANMQRSVERVLARSTPVETEPAVILPEELEVFPDNDAEGDPEPQPSAPAAPLPEAPVSITLKAMLHGHEVLVTLRGTDFASVKVQVEEASAWLRSQTPAQPDVPQCPTHGALKKSTKGKGWYCPNKATDGQWCQGR